MAEKELEIRHLQNEDKWMAERMGKFTASSSYNLLQNTKCKTEKDFSKGFHTYLLLKAAEKLSGVPREIKSSAMDWGNEHEADAIILYQEKTGVEPVENGFIPLKGYEEWAGGSPDGFVGDDGIIEVKCPFISANHLDAVLSGDIPKKSFKRYNAQIQFNLWVTGRKWCDYISYDPRVVGNEIFIKRIERDDKFIKALEKRLILAIEEFKKVLEKLK